ncbi:MAG: ABC transporter permease, partial [Stomatobaculum sp.]|nr:ABC transporter permease [Stomatobaculum sp.]
MLKLLILRDRLRAFYGKYSSVLVALLRFLLALTAMLIMNRGLGYMKTLRSPAIPLVLALISSV